MEAPVISLVSAAVATGTITLNLSQDPLFPAATTTIYLLDPITKTVLATFPGLTPPVAVIGPAISTTIPYEISAITYDVGTTTYSPPAVATSLTPMGWDQVGKNIVVTDFLVDADSYELWRIDTGVMTFISASDVHLLVDSTVYADDDEANSVQYQVKALVAGNDGGGTRIVERFRSYARLCFVYGYTAALNSHYDNKYEMWFKIKSLGTKTTLAPRQIQPFVQSFQVSREELRVHTNTAGKWGVYLLQGALVEVYIPTSGLSAEFVVPTASTAALESIPLVARPILPALT